MLRTIFAEALAACHPRCLLPQHLPAAQAQNLHLIALGKAAPAMAQVASEVLGARIRSGLVVSKTLSPLPQPFIGLQGNHPVPGADSLRAGQALLNYCRNLPAQDQVLVLLSGGASSLVELPRPGVSLEEVAQLNRQLLREGWPIEEMNRRRAQFSQIKGGGLATWLPPNTVTLVLSDVLDAPLEVVGSGPTAGLPLTLVGDSQSLLQAACESARRLGLEPQIYNPYLRGEASRVGQELARWTSPGLWIAAGETTVTVTGPGRGGRCQELVLAFVCEADPHSPRTLLAAGSDGEDGPDMTVAGAWADQDTSTQARQRGREPERYRAEQNSFEFFQAMGQHLTTGPTGTNLNDLVLLWVAP